MKKTAIVLGATGLTGGYLLNKLLASDDYEKVKVFTRRHTENRHKKLEEITCNLLALEEYADKFRADEVFCCIGTTKRKTPEQSLYHAIDYGIPVTAAKLAERNKVRTFSVISAIGANKNSRIFYSRTKGEMEQAVLQCDIPNILIYRPSFIFGKRCDKRFAENIGLIFAKLLQVFFIGKLTNYRAIHAEQLSVALYFGAKRKTGHRIIFKNEFDSNGRVA